MVVAAEKECAAEVAETGTQARVLLADPEREQAAGAAKVAIDSTYTLR